MQEQNTVGQRFTQLIAYLGISKNAFATSLDKTATVIQHLVEERNKPGFDLLCKVFEVYPNVSKDWLLQGAGPMLTTESAPVAPQEEPLPAEASVGTAVVAAPAPVAEPTLPTPAPVSEPVPVSMPAPVAAPVSVPAAAPEPGPVIPQPAPAVSAPPAAAAPAPDAAAWQTALYTQQMAHQLALAELRNQHLQDQQRLMQQMMDLMQRKLM